MSCCLSKITSYFTLVIKYVFMPHTIAIRTVVLSIFHTNIFFTHAIIIFGFENQKAYAGF